ncbi:TRAP transporter small permease [Homoserinimonas sp. A447]
MKRLVDQARGVTRILGIAETILGALLMLLIFALMLLQVAQRYLPIGPGVWVGELARFGLVWLTFALAGYLVSKNEHVAIGVIDTWLKGDAWRRGVIVFVNIVIVVVAILFAIDAWAMVQGATMQKTPATGIPLSFIYIIPLIGFVLSAVHGVVRVFSGITLPLADLIDEEESLANA